MLDKDALLEAYMILDQEYSRSLENNLNYVYRQIEKATGYKYERSLKKIKRNDSKE